MNSTSTCSFSAPLDYQGNAPALPTDIWNFSAESCTTITDNGTSTSGISTTGGFTYGELVISMFLFFLLVVTSYTFLYRWVRGHKIHI